MVDIPESLLRRSAEAKAKALGVPVEQVLAEMKGEGPPVEVGPPEPATAETPSVGAPSPETEPAPEEASAADAASADTEVGVAGATPKADAVSVDTEPEADASSADTEVGVAEEAVSTATAVEEAPATEEAPAAEPEEPTGNGAGDGNGAGKVAAMVSARPTVPPAGLPEGVRTQRLLTVVKARAIQTVKAEPQDKVNTWPHLMLIEFGALLAITGILVIMSVIIHSPLLDPANFNATPNPSKAPWYFLGLQELLSYFDPQIAGVMIPTFTGMIGFMMIPYVDRNPSTRPSDRKFAIILYSIFIAGSATLTIIGVLFRGKGFNWAYPWRDGIFFDDLKDWVNFE